MLDVFVKLYPDAWNFLGKGVMLIIDSGPGQNKEDLLVALAAGGFLLHPGVSNSTHVTQPMDCNNGYFKHQSTERTSKSDHQHKQHHNLPQSDYPLLNLRQAGWMEQACCFGVTSCICGCK